MKKAPQREKNGKNGKNGISFQACPFSDIMILFLCYRGMFTQRIKTYLGTVGIILRSGPRNSRKVSSFYLVEEVRI